MDSSKRGTEKKSSFVLKEFMPQKDKSTNDAVVTLRPNMYATAKSDDTEAKLRKDTVGMVYRFDIRWQAGLVQYDDFKRLKAEIEQNRERNASPSSDSGYEMSISPLIE